MGVICSGKQCQRAPYKHMVIPINKSLFVYLLVKVTIYLEESMCLFGQNGSVATGIQFVNTCIQPLVQKARLRPRTSRSHWSPQIENGGLTLFAPQPPPLLYDHCSVISCGDMRQKQIGSDMCHLSVTQMHIYLILLSFPAWMCLPNYWQTQFKRSFFLFSFLEIKIQGRLSYSNCLHIVQNGR